LQGKVDDGGADMGDQVRERMANEGVELRCPHCGYTWKSKSKGERVCCPGCGKSFKKA
jgi:rubrerythrin